MPQGVLTAHGANLLAPSSTTLPAADVSGIPARAVMARSSAVSVRVEDGTIAGDLVVRHEGGESNALPLRVAVPMAETLHPVGNPAVDGDGVVFAMYSGARGQEVPVSVFRVERDFQMRPFARGLLNATGLAFGPGGDLYVSSRSEGTVYRVDQSGLATPFAEGLGLASGLAFDPEGNLYVGDRSGTIFKVPPDRGAPLSAAEREIFVVATLEPSISAYHLAFDGNGVLYVTGPTTSSSQEVHAIDRNGNVSSFFKGLGRAQGIAFDEENNLYVAASYRGRRGLVRISPDHDANLVLSGPNLVGLAFLEDGCATLATRDALFHVDLEVNGRVLPFLTRERQ